MLASFRLDDGHNEVVADPSFLDGAERIGVTF